MSRRLIALLAVLCCAFTAPVGHLGGGNADPSTLLVDFTTGTLPSSVVFTGTGDPVLAQTGDPLLTSTPLTLRSGANTPIYETRGSVDGAGMGLWVMGGFSNFFGTFDHRYDLWTAVGSPTVTINATTAPDGTSAAGLVQDTSASTLEYITETFGGNGSYTASIWVKDYATSPPTAPGLFSLFSTRATGYSLGSGSSTWRRVVTSGAAATSDSGGIMQVLPAGTVASATGGVYLYGESKYNGYVDWPSVQFVSSHAYQGSSVQIAAGKLGNVFSPIGDADIEVNWIAAYDWQEHGADQYWFKCTTPDGDFSLALTSSTSTLGFKVRGTTIMTVPNIGVGVRGHYVKVRAWYKPSTGQAGIRVCYQNACYIDLTTTASGAPLSTPTACFIGSLDASTPPTDPINGRLVQFRNHTLATVTPIRSHLLVVGDSIVADDLSYPLSSQWMYSGPEASSLLPIASIAHPGDLIGDQKTAYLASPWYGDSNIKVILNQIGVNDTHTVGPPFPTAATIESRLQDLANTEAAGNPGAALYFALWTPAKAYFDANGTNGAGWYSVWQAVNAWLRAGNLTGAHIITTSSDDLNNGSDYLNTALLVDGINATNCDPGDGIHPITPCRAVMAGDWNARLRADGVFP